MLCSDAVAVDLLILCWKRLGMGKAGTRTVVWSEVLRAPSRYEYELLHAHLGHVENAIRFKWPHGYGEIGSHCCLFLPSAHLKYHNTTG